MRRLGALALAALLLAGCAGAEEPRGEATLWITADRGARVLLVRKVAAGVSAMQALRREADVETRYGGRFVHSIEGLEGSLGGRRDWFLFVNGIEADRGAAEYRLHPGDVEWWDYRSWGEVMRVPVVVGAFPEPFLHGYAGKRRAAAVRYESAASRGAARALARLVRARSVASRATPVPEGANAVFVLDRADLPFRARQSDPGAPPGSPVEFLVSARDALRLARNPRLARFRYEGLP